MGYLDKIVGPVVVARDMAGAQMFDLVRVGEKKLIGEIIQLRGSDAVIQVYEDTSGLKPDDGVENLHEPLSVELGPGLLSSIYDGIQRPLAAMEEASGYFIKSGLVAHPLDRERKWKFTPAVKEGDAVAAGDVIGQVPETELIAHKIMAAEPGTIKEIREGDFTVKDTVCVLATGSGEKKLSMIQKWNVRKPRPYKNKLDLNTPLVTGTRVVDTLFPIAKGGSAAIPGPFGSGKSVLQQTISKFADTQIVLYVGCGERGNEMTDVLKEFPKLEDPKTKRPLMERTILIANTSNMPVAAREASIYTGITIAEYYRDMGYDVSIMADSVSRWAEAMREISNRLEEMPGEEGYPAYLGRRLAEFYERAGRVECLGSDGRTGSVTVIGAVSPPGGDISEPVSQNTLRVVKVFLALDASLSQRRHFPSINWLRSYCLYLDNLRPWYAKEVSEDFFDLRASTMQILQKESELKDIVQLVGTDTLPEKEQAILHVARMIREDFLQQNAFDKVDAYTPLPKQYLMLASILRFSDKMTDALEKEVPLKDILDLPVKRDISRMKEFVDERELKNLMVEMDKQFEKLGENKE